MAYVTPLHSRSAVARAGQALVSPHTGVDQMRLALEVISNWRAAHAYPLNTFQATLRNKLDRLGIAKPVVGQRLKRLPSISAKLRRNNTMQLQQMQDIAGLRAVVPGLASLEMLRDNYALHSRFAHELRDIDDYIEKPKADGYRSIHLKYRYQSDSAPAYNGLNVELQIRTRLQHLWATAVETVDTFTGQAIKSGSPEPEWAQFFLLASAALAFVERCPVPTELEGVEPYEVLQQLFVKEAHLNVRARLSGFTVAVDQISKDSNKTAAYHLVVLDIARRRLRIRSFSGTQQDQLNEQYAEAEKRAAQGEPLDAVLIAGGSPRQLRRAYPNYFLDTKQFVRRLDNLESEMERMRRSRSRSGLRR